MTLRGDDNILTPDFSEIRLLTRSRRIVHPVLLGALAVGFVVSALFAWSDLFSAHVSIVLVFATLGVGLAGATVWLWSRPGAVTSRLTGTRHGLMWGASGTEHIVTFAKLSSVASTGRGASRTLRFVSGRWHADTLERCQDFEAVIRFVQANSHVEGNRSGRAL